MDNAKIHWAKILQPLRLFLHFFYGPPYSPFLNPIEEFFGLMKHLIRENVKSSRYQLICDTYSAIKKIKPY